MKTDFQRATDWIFDQVKDHIVGGRLQILNDNFALLKVLTTPGFNCTFDGNRAIFSGSDKDAETLVNQAWQDREAHRICALLCKNLLRTKRRMPPAFMQFVLQTLSYKPRPKRGRGKPASGWSERALLFRLSREASKRFGLSLSRSDESSPISACDAVAEFFTEYDRCTTHAQVKDLHFHKGFKKLRREIAELDLARAKWLEHHNANDDLLLKLMEPVPSPPAADWLLSALLWKPQS